MWGDDFYVDSCIPFGTASSNGLFVCCGNSMVEMYERCSFGTIHKWVNNLVCIQDPETFRQSANSLVTMFPKQAIYNYVGKLGVPWSLAKTCLFSLLFRYLSFTWDILSKCVAIMDNKHIKYLACVQNWLG